MGRLRRSRMQVATIDYLDERYPGLKNDCTGFTLERRENGEERLTLTLLVKDKTKGVDALEE